jgi:hypothetical protein
MRLQCSVLQLCALRWKQSQSCAAALSSPGTQQSPPGPLPSAAAAHDREFDLAALVAVQQAEERIHFTVLQPDVHLPPANTGQGEG